jgi:pimeloyl-ACP methyl ester carboxylesterase
MRMPLLAAVAIGVVFGLGIPVYAGQLPAAISTDPAPDKDHPARMEVLHIPSGAVSINGVAYLASGAGPHPTLLLLHGLPGNEKNLDLAQAVRRAGWNAITFNYRGSWGSPGTFRFTNNLEDAVAVLAFLRNSTQTAKLGIDPARIVLAGHSMGGWVTALVAGRDPTLAGAILISAADMGLIAALPREKVVASMADDMESLAGVTAEGMADEVIVNGAQWRFDGAVEGLARLPMLVLTSDDGLAPQADALVAKLRARGNERVTTRHEAADHSWSDRRIALQAAVISWLQQLH